VIKKYKNYFIVATLFLLACIPSAFLFVKYRQSESKLKSLASAPKDQNAKVLSEVGKLIQLPQGETPTIATVTDKEKLTNQPFFTNAKNGDIILIYTKAKKAILFDPIAKKIIDVAPLSISSPSPSLASPSSTLAPLKTILLNGTETVGLTKKFETELKQKIPNLTVSDRDNALKRDYEKTLLIDLDNNQSEIAQKLSQDLNILLGPLPEGEIASGSADFLIIVGEDKK